MNKKLINGVLLATLLAGSAGSFTSCKDYDDDIDNLQNQIDAINVDLAKLQEIIKSGETVTSVAQANDGVVITMGDGKTYTIKNGTNGTDGKDGVNGKDADVWTIGADGFWYKNNAKTEYRAIGETGPKGDQGIQGPQGPQGNQGIQGEQGKDGKYYVPNATTGCFDIWQEGKFVESTNIRWREESVTPTVPAMSAVFTGNSLTFANVDSGKKNDKGEVIYESVVINMGEAVGSVNFIPTVMSSVVSYPTTDSPFLYIPNYLDDAKKNSDQTFNLQGLDKSNVVTLAYRVNPSNAYVADNANASFLTRGVTSRAAGDGYNLLSVKTYTEKVGDADETRFVKKSAGEISVEALYNGSVASNYAGKNPIAALRLMNGQDWTVSDYVAVDAKSIDVVLVDSATMKAQNYATSFDIPARTKVWPAANTQAAIDAYIKQFVPLTGNNSAPIAELIYDNAKGLDLTTIPGIYSVSEGKYIKDLGFSGLFYKFSLPEYYIGQDNTTNQQWFVEIVDGQYLKVNSKNLTTGLTPALGRTPVVRVDAYILDNAGSEKMIASGFIKVNIVKEPTVAPVDKDIISVNLSDKEYEYHNLNAAYTVINSMDWKAVNTQIYGKAGLTASDFWNNYGGQFHAYTVDIAVQKNGSDVILNTGAGMANNAYTSTAVPGISVETTLGAQQTETTNVSFGVNNKVLTENTIGYDDVNGKGAKYTVTITIPSNNKAVRGDVVVKQIFYVREDCKKYNPNPLYNYPAGSINGVDCVVTKGKLVGNTWKLEMNISEAFEMLNGKNIFEYYNTVNNAKAISFDLKPGQTGVNYTPTTNNGTIELTTPLVGTERRVNMQYVVTLENNETCTFYFDVLFRNPFVAGKGADVTLNANQIGTLTTETAPSVRVDDTNGALIYSWVNGSLQLSTLAKNSYKVAEPTRTYAFDQAAYNAVKSQMDPNATFKIDPATGVVTYDNLGAELQVSKTIPVNVTVKFANISEVTCTFNFVLKGADQK